MFVTRKRFSRVLPKKADLYPGVWSWTREYPDELQISSLKFSSTEVFSPASSQPVLMIPEGSKLLVCVRKCFIICSSYYLFFFEFFVFALKCIHYVIFSWCTKPLEPLRESYRCSLDGKNGSSSFYTTTALPVVSTLHTNLILIERTE